MRKLIVAEFVSIDGVMDSPGGEPGYTRSGWTFAHADGDDQLRLTDVKRYDSGVAVHTYERAR